MYPGQEYWHRLNPNIRRAEENWMKNHEPAGSVPVVHEADERVDKEFYIFPMPPIPVEVFKFIEEAELAAQGLTVIRGKDYGKDAGTNPQR